MQPDIRIRGRRVQVIPMLCRQIAWRLHCVLSRFGPREAAWDLYGPRVNPDRRKLEIRSWVQLHHLELMKSCGRSLARSIAKGTSHVTAHAEGHAH